MSEHHFIPAAAGHEVVFITGSTVVLRGVIAWAIDSEGVVRPITLVDDPKAISDAILFPDGHVERGDLRWSTLTTFCEDQGVEVPAE